MAAGPNTLDIQGQTFLLAHAGGGVTHLVAEVGQGGIAATTTAEEYGAPISAAYDETALLEERWAPKTLCGQEQWGMEPSDGDIHDLGGLGITNPLYRLFEEPAYAPNCKRCLASIDRLFPTPEPAEIFEYAVERCLQEFEKWGSVMIFETPADQAKLLRARLRKECRARGWKIETGYRDGMLYAGCRDAVSPERRKEIDADVHERMNAYFEGREIEEPSWRLRWA